MISVYSQDIVVKSFQPHNILCTYTLYYKSCRLTVANQSLTNCIQVVLSRHNTATGNGGCGSLIMVTSTYGTLQEFELECETITTYIQWLKAYINPNDVPSAKRVSVPLSVRGPQTYSILRSLMASETLQSKSLLTIMKDITTSSLWSLQSTTISICITSPRPQILLSKLQNYDILQHPAS